MGAKDDVFAVTLDIIIVGVGTIDEILVIVMVDESIGRV